MTKIFLTGATGYVGGEFLAAISSSKLQHSIRALVRHPDAATKLKASYPDVAVVDGDLDNTDLIEREATQADVVFHLAATGHLASVKAIRRGLEKRKGGYYIQISGATVVSQAEIRSKTFGELNEKTYDDLDGASELRDVIRKYPTRAVDNYMLDLAEEDNSIRSAIVFPPLIYGRGRGPVNQRSIQVPELCRIALLRERAVHIGKGLNVWANVHVSDVGDLLLRLAEKAANEDKDEQLWNQNGLYFLGAHPGMDFLAIAKQIAESAHKQGLLKDTNVESITASEADKLSSRASAIIGTNARTIAKRAGKVLDWSPSGESLSGEIPRAVAAEAKNSKSSL